ncbi:MAG: hypothetical protein QE285_17380, partial [Aquabacterium sp.]|nr:hypothetical protein [Aquabacterium sp.]
PRPDAAAADRPYSAGMRQQAGSGGTDGSGAAKLFPAPPDGLRREAPQAPREPVPDAASNRGQAFILPAR